MKKNILKVISVLIFLILILYGYYFLNKKYNFGIPCLFKKITGYECPGCGITRCLFSIIEGDFYQAFCYNSLVFIMLPFFLFYFIYKSYLFIFDKQDKIICKIPNIVWLIILIITILFGIFRNIY